MSVDQIASANKQWDFLFCGKKQTLIDTGNG